MSETDQQESSLNGRVVFVHKSAEHGLGKSAVPSIDLVAGMGVDGDIHSGAQVQHLSRTDVKHPPPNLRQVLILAHEFIDSLAPGGHVVKAGELGENITCVGLDLQTFPVGTTLSIGDDVVLALTGLRNPCVQIERKFPGLLKKLAFKNDAGDMVRKGGVMAVVVRGGTVAPDAPILVAPPAGRAHALECV